MGCDFGFGDDYERCSDLIDEYQFLLDLEENEKMSDKKLEKHNKTKEDIKGKIRTMLEEINQKANGVSQIDRLQKLNEKYQTLLTEDSKIKNYN